MEVLLQKPMMLQDDEEKLFCCKRIIFDLEKHVSARELYL